MTVNEANGKKDLNKRCSNLKKIKKITRERVKKCSICFTKVNLES